MFALLKPRIPALRRLRRVAVSKPKLAQLRGHARANLIWGISGVVLFQGILLLLVEGPLPQLREPTFENKARSLNRAILQSGGQPAVILIFGSSVTCNSFNAKRMQEELQPLCDKRLVVYNMGNLGAGPLTQFIFLRRLLDRGIRPQHVLIECSSQFFTGAEPNDLKRFPLSQLSARDWEVIRQFQPAADGDRDLLWQKWLFPAYAYRLTILNNVARILVPTRDKLVMWDGGIDERGWTDFPSCPPEERDAALQHLVLTRANSADSLQPGESSLRAFQLLLDLVRDEKIAATVVMVPQGPTMRRTYAIGAIQHFAIDIAERCRQNGVGFVNAFDWLEEDMFNDSLHPNSLGAAVVTARINAEVLRPALQKLRAHLKR